MTAAPETMLHEAPSPRRVSTSASDEMPDVPARRTVVLSDVHLSQAHPSTEPDPLWMRYRRSEYHPDRDFEALIDRLLADTNAGPLEVVFNGDLFDFDAPWVKDGESSHDEFPLDEPGCTAQLERIIADHPKWLEATARVIAAGHRVMFLCGNHDVELCWPGARRTLRDHLVQRARAIEPPHGASFYEERVRFRTWFHLSEDGIYFEHGSQYDRLNRLPSPARPLRADGLSIHPICGKLAFKRTGALMGYFNPYYEETFYMGFFDWLSHFARFYAGTRRHIVRTWLVGAARTALDVWKHRAPLARYLLDDNDRALVRAETGACDEVIDATHALAAPSAERTMIPILRELWLDRTLLALVVVVASACAFAVFGFTGGFIAVGVLLALFVLYEVATPKPDVRTYDAASPEVRGKLLDVHGARGLCMGHTHRPFGIWDEAGRFEGNSGSWCPAFRDMQCTEPVLEGRPFLLLMQRDGALWGGLHWWRGGAIVPDEQGAKQAPSAEERRAIR